MARLLVILGAAAAVWAAFPCAHAQSVQASPSTYQPPRTAEGHPDFQGVWETRFLTRLERPKGVAELVVSPERAAEVVKELLAHPPKIGDPDFDFYAVDTLAKVKGGFRTSILVEPEDGHLPLTKKGQTENEGNDNLFLSYDNPEERGVSERCVSGLGQPPIRTLPLMIPAQVVQTPDALIIWIEDVGGFRLIHLTGAPPPDAIRSVDGYSAGRWEGDTLVVETTHFPQKDAFRDNFGPSIIVGGASKVVERFTRVSDTELFYQFTVEDKDLYSRPWLGEFSFTRSDTKVYEYACHEGNYSMINMLKVGRLGPKPKPVK